MTTSNENPVVPLATNSLYVTITPLMQGYHWSLYITDSMGVGTRHHWSQVTRARGDTTSPIEHYNHGIINPVRVYTRVNNCHLGFFRIASYTAPGADFDFVSLFRSIFPASYATIRDNRKYNITCRTWLLNALILLQDKGVIVHGSPIAESVEMTVKAKGGEQEKILQKCVEEKKLFVPVIVNI